MATQPNNAVVSEQVLLEPKYQWFTTVPEDWFALIVRGRDLHRIIHGIKEWRVNENFEFEEGEEIFSPIRIFLGREFAGVPGIQGLYRYKFAWNKYWRKTENGKETPEYDIQTHKAENIIFTPFKSQYPITFSGIEVSAKDRGKGETEDSEEALIPIGIEITVRIRIIRPKVALMTNVDWLGGVLVPNLQKGLKNFVGEKTYDEMIRGSKKTVSSEFVEYIMGATSSFKQNVLENAGVEIIDIGITDIIPNKEFEETLIGQAQAQRNALAKIATAEGEKQSKILLAEGEKQKSILEGEGEAAKIISIAGAESKRIDLTTLKVAGGYGDNATIIERWRQIHGSGLTTYVEAGAKASILVDANGRSV